MTNSEYGALRNQYDGERVFLIGNGPSLNETPLSKLQNEHTFAVNKINKIYQITDWRPTLYLNTIGGDVAENIDCTKENIRNGAITFIDREYKSHFGSHSNLFSIEPEGVTGKLRSFSKQELQNMEVESLLQYWSENISQRVYSFHSMYIMMQIVDYLGFNEVYLIGCDLNYGQSDSHLLFEDGLDPVEYIRDNNKSKKQYVSDSLQDSTPVKSVANGVCMNLLQSSTHKLYVPLLQKLGKFGETDDDHFADDYRGPTMIKRMADSRDTNDELKKSHVVAHQILSYKDISVYNSTLGGELEVYPRVSLDAALNSVR